MQEREKQPDPRYTAAVVENETRKGIWVLIMAAFCFCHTGSV
jgi:hypothetical protein